MGAAEEAVVRKGYELWAGRDAKALAALFAEDGVYDNVPIPGDFRGPEAVRKWLEVVFQRLWVEVELLNMASNGEWVLSERIDHHVDGDVRKPLPVMNASRIVDGKIAVWRDYFDMKTVADLGLV